MNSVMCIATRFYITPLLNISHTLLSAVPFPSKDISLLINVQRQLAFTHHMNRLYTQRHMYIWHVHGAGGAPRQAQV